MMKPARLHIEPTHWDAGHGFIVPAPFRGIVKRNARAVTLRGHGVRGLLQPHRVPLEPFEGQGPWPTSRPWHWGIFLAAWFLAIPATHAQATNSAAGSRTNLANRLDLSSFRIISDRNIFNSARSGRSSRSGEEAPKPAKLDSFTLVGTMAYEKGRFAFFEGSGSEFRKVLKPDGVIAGYKILDIAPGNVRLGRDGKEIELRVGTQMRRQDEGDWQQSAQTGSYPGSGKSTPAAKTDSTGTAPDSGGDDSEILKRLLQKREAEENK